MPLPITALVQSIAQAFDRCDLRPAPKRFNDITSLGIYGERVAARFLTRNHRYKVLVRNYTTERGEIDLVCRVGNILVFVEVRTRYDDSFGLPVESIKEAKRRHLRLAGEQYLRELEHPETIFRRFDAVSVFLQPGHIPRCLLHPDLFQLRD